MSGITRLQSPLNQALGLSEWGERVIIPGTMDDELIETNQQFSVNSIDGSKIESLTVNKLRAGTLNVDAYLQSTGYVAGTTGWRINGDGSVEFDSGYFRGDITGATGTFSGTITGGSLNIPDTTTANSFHVETDGDTFWGTTPALFTSDNNNAPAYILRTGAARFTDIAISIGSSNSIFKADTNGIYLGNATFASAPFRVNMSGALTATSATITGAITASSGSITGGFSVLAGLTVGSGGSFSSGQTNYDTGTGFWLDYNSGTPRFSLGNSAGNKLTWDGTTMTITGSLSATTGSIGGWTINSTSITDVAAVVGLSSAVTGGDDIRFWAGNVTPASAAFRVTEAGALTATSATITGAITATSGTIGSFTIGTYLYTGSKTAYNDANAGVHIGGDGIGIGNNVFTVSSAGALVATSATITGAITATSGAIGGWNINSTSIYTGTEDHSGYTANAGDMTLYSNGSDASIHANKFYIDSAGVLNCTAAVVAGAVTTTAGSSVDGTYLVPYTVTSGKAALALVGWTQTCAFTVTDADTVAWGSGTLTLSDGTAYSISAGNTGNMAAKTYIYLDVGVSTTAYQTTTTAATAIGDDKILLAIAQNGTGEATFMLLNNNSYNIDAANIVAGSITANEIAASTITANKIAANTITANELTTGAFVTTTANITDAIITSAKISDLSVAKLTAGTISSKAILLGITAGTGDSYIAGGNNLDLTNWRGGDGSGGAIILGLDDSDSDKGKFFAGNYSTSQYIQFDGTDMTISANLNIDAAYTAATAITAGDVIEQGASANNAQKQTIDDIISNDIYDVSTLTSWSSQFVICKLDTNLYVGAWYKGSSTYSVAVFSYKNGKFIRGPIENTATDGRTPFTIFGIIKLSTTKALLGYTYDSGGTTNYGVRVYSVQSDKSLSVSSVTNLGSISTGTSGGLLTRISDDKFMVAWSGFGGGNPKAVCCTVSGTTVTAGTTKDLGDTATTGSVTSLILLDTDKLMTIVIQSSATRAAVLTVTGTTTITQGTVEPLANSNGNNATLSKLSTTKALVVFRNSASNLLTSGILNVSGTTITEVAAQTQVDTGTPAYEITSIPYSSSLVGVFYKKDSPYDTSSWFKYLTVDGSDNITASNPLLFTGYSTINFVKCDENLSDDFDALFFTGDKYLTGFSFKATKKSIGIAPANISAAASGTIRNKGLITGLSGYTVGQNIRDRYDMSIRAIAKDTTILNVI